MSDAKSLKVNSKDLANTLKAIRRSGYRADGGQGSLGAILSLNKHDEEYIKALLIKFVDHFFGRIADGDILLMAFGLLEGYSQIGIGERRKLYLDESNYLKPDQINDEKAYDRLRQKDDDLIKKLADRIIIMGEISDFVNDVSDYLEKTEVSGSTKIIYRAILPTPAYLDKSDTRDEKATSTSKCSTELDENITDKIFTPRACVYNLPIRNKFFTGRKKVLDGLHSTFREQGIKIQVITGKGGIGKSQTAREYAHRFIDEYTDAVWWINAGSPLDDCKKLIVRFGFPKDNNDAEEIKSAFDIWCQNHDSWLLIFDDADSWSVVEPFLADLQLDIEEYDMALSLYEKSLELRKKGLNESHPYIADSYDHIAAVYQYIGEFEKALELHEKCLNLRINTLGLTHPDTAATYNNLGSFYARISDFPKALEYHQKALEIETKVFGEQHSATAMSYNNMGTAYAKLHDYDKALELCKRSLKIRQALYGEDNYETASAHKNIANILMKLDNPQSALDHFTSAFKYFNSVFEADHPNINECFSGMYGAFIAMGKKEEGFQDWLDNYLS